MTVVALPEVSYVSERTTKVKLVPSPGVSILVGVKCGLPTSSGPLLLVYPTEHGGPDMTSLKGLLL